MKHAEVSPGTGSANITPRDDLDHLSVIPNLHFGSALRRFASLLTALSMTACVQPGRSSEASSDVAQSSVIGVAVDNSDPNMIRNCGRPLTEAALFSFSVGNDKRGVENILPELKQNDVRGLFFVTPRWATLYGGELKKIRDEGHLVGIQTADQLVDTSDVAVDQMLLDRSFTNVASIANTEPKLIRPAAGGGLPFPGKKVNPDLSKTATANSMQLCGWEWSGDEYTKEDIDVAMQSFATVHPIHKGDVMIFNTDDSNAGQKVARVASALGANSIPFQRLSTPKPNVKPDPIAEARRSATYRWSDTINNLTANSVMNCNRKLDSPGIFTFDDFGTKADVLERLDQLDALHARGIFFVMGNWAVDNPALIDEMKRRGHYIGYHSFSHPHLVSDDESTTYTDLFDAEITPPAGLTNTDPILFRPPFGDGLPFTGDPINPTLAAAVSKKGMQLCGWRWDSNDWMQDHTPDVILSVLRNGEGDFAPLAKGDVMLFHIRSANVSAGLPAVGNELKRLQYPYEDLGTPLPIVLMSAPTEISR